MGKVKEIRVVIDTNVIMSAILFGGIPGELMPLWKSGRIKPLASKEIIDEYIKVYAVKIFEEKECNEFNWALTPLINKKILDCMIEGSYHYV